MKTVHQLRKEGFKVRIRHLRYFKNENGGISMGHKTHMLPGEILLAKGGETQIEILTPDKKSFFFTSRCKSKFDLGKQTGDAFNRKLGIRIALGRFLKAYEAV